MAVHRAGRNPENSRGLKFVARALGDRCPHQPLGGLVDTHADGNCYRRLIRRGRLNYPVPRIGANFCREHKAVDDLVVAQRRRSLNNVIEFPDIAGPCMGQQLLQRSRGDGADVFAQHGRKSAQEMPRQQGNISTAFAQRGQYDLNSIDPVIQIVPEFSLGYRLWNVSVGRAENTHVDLNFLRSAQALKISVLQHAKQRLACNCGLISAISSSNNVPPSASSNFPGRAAFAPVNAPRSWPNNSLSSKVSGIAAQLIFTNGMGALGLLKCRRSASAAISLPACSFRLG